MSTLEGIAFFQNRRDEVPNIELAKKLASKKDKNGIAEIAENLFNKNKNISADCVKVMYEIGALNPSLIADYNDLFLKLLKSKDNRMVWGAMTALGETAKISGKELLKFFDEIKFAIEHGTVITVDNGITTLAFIAASSDASRAKIFPYLLKHLETCRTKEVPQHAERTLVAVNDKNLSAFTKVLEKRIESMSASQAARIKKILKTLQKEK